MSRLDYHPTYTKSVRDSKLPHYGTPFTDSAGTLRHPMDYKYHCGFDPLGKTLKKCVDHWQTCKSKECQAKARNWDELKEEMLFAYGLMGF